MSAPPPYRPARLLLLAFAPCAAAPDGRRRHSAEGLGMGLVTGALGAALAGAAACENGLFAVGECIGVSALAGGVVGGVLGLAIGTFVRTDRWRPLVRLGPSGGGIGLAIPVQRRH